MNINSIMLVLVETITGFVFMCKILMVGVMFIECMYLNSTFLGHNSLLLVLIFATIRHKILVGENFGITVHTKNGQMILWQMLKIA